MITLLCFLILLGLEFLIIAGLTWVACWALALLGFAVAWSWTASLGVFILIEIFRIIF